MIDCIAVWSLSIVCLCLFVFVCFVDFFVFLGFGKPGFPNFRETNDTHKCIQKHNTIVFYTLSCMRRRFFLNWFPEISGSPASRNHELQIHQQNKQIQTNTNKQLTGSNRNKCIIQPRLTSSVTRRPR
jgi:hypothetical protein